jgi:AraC-like DNA-binding protein
MLAIKLTGADRSADRLRILMLQVFFTVADVNVHKTDQQASSSGFRLLRKFQKLIEKNYAGLRLPKDYAGMLAVTPNHLNAVCSQILGLSAGDMIRNRIQLEAKRLLVNLELPISEIAYKLNFNDNSYFTKFFKKHAGVTPEEFRKQISKLQS